MQLEFLELQKRPSDQDQKTCPFQTAAPEGTLGSVTTTFSYSITRVATEQAPDAEPENA